MAEKIGICITVTVILASSWVYWHPMKILKWCYEREQEKK